MRCFVFQDPSVWLVVNGVNLSSLLHGAFFLCPVEWEMSRWTLGAVWGSAVMLKKISGSHLEGSEVGRAILGRLFSKMRRVLRLSMQEYHKPASTGSVPAAARSQTSAGPVSHSIDTIRA